MIKRKRGVQEGGNVTKKRMGKNYTGSGKRED